MASYRRFLQSVAVCGRQALSYTSTKVPRQTNILRQNMPCLHKVSASFSTTSARLDKAGVVFNVQDEEDFQKRVIKSDVPIVVDFHADWCGPCKVLGPRIEGFVDAKKGRLLLAKVDIDELQDLAVSYGVKAVPTVIAVKNGQVVDEFVGNKDDDVIKSFINKLVSD